MKQAVIGLSDALDALIVHNRRVNYRVEPPPALASRLRVEGGREFYVESIDIDDDDSC